MKFLPFQPQKLFDKLTNFKRFEAEVELRSKQLSHLRLDASSIEAVKKLKGKIQGKLCPSWEWLCQTESNKSGVLSSPLI